MKISNFQNNLLRRLLPPLSCRDLSGGFFPVTTLALTGCCARLVNFQQSPAAFQVVDLRETKASCDLALTGREEELHYPPSPH